MDRRRKILLINKLSHPTGVIFAWGGNFIEKEHQLLYVNVL